MTDFHFGFNVDSPGMVDRWSSWLRQHAVPIYEDVTEDKYRSIKFRDPDGHWIEISYEEWAPVPNRLRRLPRPRSVK